MKDVNKWRREADRLLKAPVVRVRAITTVAGKVEDRFDQVMAARKRGMPWRMIADALASDGDLKEESVESAFRRLCSERGMTPPGRRQTRRSKRVVNDPNHDRTDDEIRPMLASQQHLLGEHDRWVDNGDD